MPEISNLTPIQVIGVGLAVGVLYIVGQSIYRLFFHPLSKFPGPKIAAVSEAWWAWALLSGRQPFHILDAHRKHGDIVRIAPNELSFASPQSYQDIYGHVSKGRGRFLKTEFYDNGPPRIVSARDPEVHARQRKALSHAFSAKALRGQETIVHQYVDLFVEQLSRLGNAGKKAIDASEAYNWVTFDIIGDLAFGESFNAVSDGKTNSWIAIIFDGVAAMMISAARKRLAVVKYLEPWLVAPKSADKLATHVRLSKDKARKRIQMGGDSRRDVEDFFGHMIRKGTITEQEMTDQARTLIIAGSETTATTLSGLTWYLLRNPECLAKLQHEVRSTFSSFDEITGDSTASLKYLHGVIEEGLRMFPAVSTALPRYSPGAVIDGHYVPAGVIVSNSGYSMTRDSRYWHDPTAFRPERWIDENFQDELRASQPFSTGPRACLGINLAYLELRIILAKVAFTYDLELESKHLENWNESCQSAFLWKRPELFVKFVPFKPIKNHDNIEIVA
ncbi:hypothetical protein PFICI_10653 [Pestalotiopsis fici W106-1]|uniref:Isotrichodermin C-15 hydroxylase n=1 Tax=Pestalotiopsis fici (strain W106-1 / CGMCC3.15140) TaxID=1229662 RepID=W3X0C0_PESFW|nr:uncharacterized protein PFICI_10653 [Pestalotiopsis fici W106-1]ETS78591.1 hypothetical protein PFICI_10653 [Pestalotiopsis fici W106-1]